METSDVQTCAKISNKGLMWKEEEPGCIAIEGYHHSLVPRHSPAPCQFFRSLVNNQGRPGNEAISSCMSNWCCTVETVWLNTAWWYTGYDKHSVWVELM